MTKSIILKYVIAICLFSLLSCSKNIAQEVQKPEATEESWYPSKYGPDDTRGALNLLSPEKVLQAAKLIKTGKTYSLAISTGSSTPAFGHRNYNLTVLYADFPGPEKICAQDDLLNTWLGIGTQIDGFGHMGYDKKFYNGLPMHKVWGITGLKELGIHKLPPIVTKGILLDVAGHFGKEILDKGKEITPEDIKAVAKAQNVVIEEGDVVLFHTGWMNHIGEDNHLFESGEPGINAESAEYLASLGVVAIGADNYGLEAYPKEGKRVHPILLAKHGIHILEFINTRALAKDEAYEFLFVLGTPKIEGAVQAIINPIAIR